MPLNYTLYDKRNFNSNGAQPGGIASTYLKLGKLPIRIYLHFYKAGGEFTLEDIRRVTGADDRELHSAIGSLLKGSRIRRVRRGVYRVTGSV